MLGSSCFVFVFRVLGVSSWIELAEAKQWVFHFFSLCSRVRAARTTVWNKDMKLVS